MWKSKKCKIKSCAKIDNDVKIKTDIKTCVNCTQQEYVRVWHWFSLSKAIKNPVINSNVTHMSNTNVLKAGPSLLQLERLLLSHMTVMGKLNKDYCYERDSTSWTYRLSVPSNQPALVTIFNTIKLIIIKFLLQRN